MPPELRRQLLEAIEEGRGEDDPIASLEDGVDTMTPQGYMPEYATPIGDAPEGAIGSMQHLLSKQLESLKGTKTRGVYFKDEDPADPEKFIKGRGGEKTIVPIMQDPKVVFCDLATEEGRAEYERVMNLLATSLGTYQLFEPEQPPHIRIDRNGIPHAIVILKYCKMTKVVAVKQEKYTEISEEAMKERFFQNHQAAKVEDEEGNPLDDTSGDEG